MNPVNATSLYVSASRSVLQCDPRDPRALAELCKLLPFFRQSLSCLVCGNLLQDPIAPTDSSCQHYVCRGCKGQRMQLKPSCSWCKDYSRFQENRQLSLLVHCYRKLCLYIAQSPLAPHIAGAAGDSPDLQAILDEGLTLAESEEKQDAATDADAVDSPDSGGAAAAAPSEVRLAEEVLVVTPPEAVVVNAEVKAEEDSPGQLAAGVNGLHDCNGLAESDALRPITIETGGGGGRVVLKSEVFSDQLPVCVSVTAGGGGDGDDASLCEITAFGEELKHSGGSLLLSVEEVLRTLESSTVNPDPDPPDPLPLPVVASPPLQPDCDHHHHQHHNASSSSSSVPHAAAGLLNNGPHCPLGPDSSRHTPSLPPENSPRPPLQPHPHPQPSPPPRQTPPPPPSQAVANAAPPRCHRKRSRSESDSEKVQPLPIASLLPPPPPPPLGANNNSPHHHPHHLHHHNLHHHHHHHHLGLAKREPKFPSPGGGFTPPHHHHHHPHLAPVPNGGPPKVGKTVLVSGGKGGLKKAVDHHHGGQKKAYAKARQGGGGGGGGVPKPRGTQPHARMPPHPHHSHPLSHPPSPSKPLYKKPVEKKGCKCGRATQNPSVLTCRGQRCPCYSNRKACLDCICRGCQNSYMANGEKKLEAFAVPEKALEQTRLTLGINLTSITAAALRSPATGGAPASGGGNALINVAGAAGTPATPAVTAAAAFSISGAGHDSRAFDDSLEMRFDC